jgi:hypothetical protein
MYELYVKQIIEEGHTIPHEEAKQRLLGSLKSGSINTGLTLRSKARRRMRCIMKSRRHVSVLGMNRAGDGHTARHAHLRMHQSPATLALAFALMCAIIGAGSTCRSLI